MRKPLKDAPQVSALKTTFEDQWITEEHTYEITTFLMGGGVEPYEADSITTVRAAEIKGLLRYWWRATRGGGFNGDLAAMRREEAKIWGWSADEKNGGPSKVKVSVEIIAEGSFEEHDRDERGQIRKRWNKKKQQREPIRLGDPQSNYGYVAFPLRDRENGGVRRGVRFRMRLLFPKDEKIKEEVQAALWAWETFGGIGARTRRGFGALRRIDEGTNYPSRDQVESWLRQGLSRYANFKAWPQDVPYLSPEMNLVVESFDEDPFSIWQKLVSALKRFRQARPGRGRSLWPEPDAIRHLTKRWVPRHEPVHPVRKFPRGQMGLPIVFHFKDSGDPPDTILQGPLHDRWASRLILKPLPCKEGYVGLVAVLQGPDRPPNGWKLVEIEGKTASKGGYYEFSVEAELEENEAQRIKPLKGKPDVLQAVLNFLEHKQ
jgi:CRISPR-associated protein Cmr1